MGKRRAAAPAGKQRAAKKRPGGESQWWEEAEEVPRAGLPDATKLARRAKRLRRFVWASVVLLPLSLFANFIIITNSGAQATSVTEARDSYAETRSDAIVAVRTWLSSSPSPLPGGSLVGWDWATSKNSPSDPQHPEDDYTVEVHHLTVASASGAIFDTAVSLGVSKSAGVVVIGQPTLIPRAPADTSFDGSAWPGVDSVVASDEVEAAVVAWGDAYDSADPAALRLAVGDGNEAHSYMPLVGATLLNGSVEDAAGIWPADVPAADHADVEPDTEIVEATFQIHWAGTKLGETESDYPTVTYDLLVKKANTAAPVVVAWGGAGTGPSLKPFVNAITGRVVEPPDAEEANPKNGPLPTDPTIAPAGQPHKKGHHQ